jgi:hypothetical protein
VIGRRGLLWRVNENCSQFRSYRLGDYRIRVVWRRKGETSFEAMERKKRIIYESDEDEEEKRPQISIEKEKKIPILTAPAIATKTEAENDGIVNSDEEWDSRECLEFMHGRCDDEAGAIPIKIINEQLGDDGVEYEVTFEEQRGNGRVSVYHDWVRDVDLTKRMLVLKEEYEQGNDRGGSATDEQNVDGTYSSDENRPHPPAAAHASMAIIGSNERVPGAPRRSSRGSSSGTRRAVTRQKLNDLIELRNRSKSGLGVLQLSSEEEEESKSDVENGATPPEEEDEDDELVIRGRHRLFPPSPPHKVKSQVSHTPRMFKRRRKVNDEEEEEEDDEEQDDRAGGRGGREDDGIESFIVGDDEGEEELYEEEVLEER